MRCLGDGLCEGRDHARGGSHSIRFLFGVAKPRGEFASWVIGIQRGVDGAKGIEAAMLPKKDPVIRAALCVASMTFGDEDHPQECSAALHETFVIARRRVVVVRKVVDVLREPRDGGLAGPRFASAPTDKRVGGFTQGATFGAVPPSASHGHCLGALRVR